MVNLMIESNKFNHPMHEGEQGLNIDLRFISSCLGFKGVSNEKVLCFSIL